MKSKVRLYLRPPLTKDISNIFSQIASETPKTPIDGNELLVMLSQFANFSGSYVMTEGINQLTFLGNTPNAYRSSDYACRVQGQILLPKDIGVIDVAYKRWKECGNKINSFSSELELLSDYMGQMDFLVSYGLFGRPKISTDFSWTISDGSGQRLFLPV